MQDRYAGDIGDFSKYALLRALSPGRRIGLCWYLTSGEGEANNDGNHLAYLGQPERFRRLEPKVFEVLSGYRGAVVRKEKMRSIAALEQLGLVPQTTRYHRTLVPRRKGEREAWRRELVASMVGADLVMLDPDNGLEAGQLTHKAASFDELSALRSPGRTLVLYHHQTRMKGGAKAEVPYLAQRLAKHGHGGVEAIRFSPYSSRYYLLLDATPELVARLDALAKLWGDECDRFSAGG